MGSRMIRRSFVIIVRVRIVRRGRRVIERREYPPGPRVVQSLTKILRFIGADMES
jgi:hypothetical protein